MNELARELEVKAKAIIDLLPGYGVTEKKTHSSSIPEDVAVKDRAKIKGESEDEPSTQSAAKPDAQAKEAAARAARSRLAPTAPAPVAAAPSGSAPAARPPARPRRSLVRLFVHPRRHRQHLFARSLQPRNQAHRRHNVRRRLRRQASVRSRPRYAPRLRNPLPRPEQEGLRRAPPCQIVHRCPRTPAAPCPAPHAEL